MDWRGLLKPTKEKIIFFLVISSLHLLVPLLKYFFQFSEVFFANILYMAPLVLFNLPVVAVLYLDSTLAYILAVHLKLPATTTNMLLFGLPLILLYWWLITCLFSPLFKRFSFNRTVKVFAITFILVYLLDLAFILSVFGWDKDRDCFPGPLTGYEKGYKVTWKSNLAFDCGFGDNKGSCIGICFDDAIHTKVRNTGNIPVVLESMKVINGYGESCSRNFNKDLEPGEETEVVVREGCPDLEGNLTFEVTYTQKINGKKVRKTETGTLEPTKDFVIS